MSTFMPSPILFMLLLTLLLFISSIVVYKNSAVTLHIRAIIRTNHEKKSSLFKACLFCTTFSIIRAFTDIFFELH